LIFRRYWWYSERKYILECCFLVFYISYSSSFFDGIDVWSFLLKISNTFNDWDSFWCSSSSFNISNDSFIWIVNCWLLLILLFDISLRLLDKSSLGFRIRSTIRFELILLSSVDRDESRTRLTDSCCSWEFSFWRLVVVFILIFDSIVCCGIGERGCFIHLIDERSALLLFTTVT